MTEIICPLTGDPCVDTCKLPGAPGIQQAQESLNRMAQVMGGTTFGEAIKKLP